MKLIQSASSNQTWINLIRPLAACVVLAQSSLGGQVVQNLSYTGDVQSWTVPSGVEAISVTLTGAQGGRGADDDPGVGAAGGAGGRVTGRLAVTPGEVLTFHLGSAGSSGSFASNTGGGAGGVTAGGLYAGGRGGNAGGNGSSGGGGGGGGAAAMLRDGTVLAVAGGAGGGGGAGGSTQWFLSDNQANRDGLSGYTGGYSTTNAGANGADRGSANDGGGGGGGGGGYTRGGSGGSLRKTGNNNTGGNGGSAGENLTSGMTAASASYVAVTGAAGATISYMEPSVFNAVYASSAAVPLTAASVDVSNATLDFQLGHAPAAGAILTIANNTGTGAVTGTFVGLAQGATVTGSYGGDTFRFTLSYTGGTGNDITLTREAAKLPLVTGGTASRIGSENVTITAAVNPNGFTTTAVVEYGYSNVYGRSQAITLASSSGSVSQNVSATLESLKPGTLYHYRVSATNADGTSSTANGTFTTLSGGAVSPADRVAGMVDQTIVITGGGFVNGATLSFSGEGITVKNVTVNSAQQMTAIIDIDLAAAPGSRRVTVTNPDGSQWIANGTLDVAGFDPGNGANGDVFAVLPLPDGRTLIGGGFTAYDTYSSKRLARLNADGSFDTTFVPVIDGAVRSIVRQSDGKLLIGGDFTTIGTTARARIARLNADGTLDTTFAPGSGANQSVRAILLQADGKVLIGGDFTTVNGTTRNRLARLSAAGALESAYNPNVNGPVHALLSVPDGTLVGGAFGTIGTSNVFNIALLSATGVPNMDFTDITVIGEHDFGVRSSGTVSALALEPDGSILVGGDFIEANGLPCLNLVRLFSTGMVRDSGNVAGPVRSIIPQADESVLVAGVFAKGIVRLDSFLASDSTFTTRADAAIHALALQTDGKLLAGGAFTTVDNVNRRGIARFNTDGLLDLPVRSAAFTVWEPMRLDSVDATGLPQGLSNRSLVLTGAGFKPGASVSFSNPGITVSSLTVNHANRMTAVVNVNASAALGPVSVTVNNTDGGTDTLEDAFVVSAQPAVASIAPASRAAGSQDGQLVVEGSGFQTGATLAFSGTGITLKNVSVQSANRITAGIDLDSSAGVGTRHLVVTNPDGGTVTKTSAFAVNAAPTLASLAPSVRAVGLQGQSLVLTGNHFQAGAQVAFSGSGITVKNVTVDSSTQLTLTADIESTASTGSRDITVTQPDGGSAVRAGVLTLTPQPTLSAVNPAQIPQGGTKTVTLTGTGFSSGVTVSSSSTGIEIRNVTLVSPTEITADLTAGQASQTGTHAMTVMNADGGSATINTAIAVIPGPKVLSLTPSRRVVGMQDQTLVLIGTDFSSNPTAEFAGSGITVESATRTSQTSITLVVDISVNAVVGPRALTVTNPDGGSFTLDQALTLSEPLKLTAVAPATRGQGAMDQQVALTGSGMQDGAQVSFGDGIAVKQVSCQSDSQLTAVLDVAPTATLGGRSVTVTNPDGQTVTVAPVVLNPGFISAGAGPDGAVRSIRRTSDGKIVAAGSFSRIGALARGRIARLNADGSLDASFDPGLGFDGDVVDVAVQSDGKIIAAGAFTSFDGSPCGSLVRINADGSLDTIFAAAASIHATPVSRIALQADGKLVVAGQTSMLRLNADGSADSGFATVNRQVTAIVLQPDGRIIAAGAGFLNRYTTGGVEDAALQLGPLTCTALALQSNGKILFGGASGEGGAFVRLNTDLSIDPTFSAGQLGSMPITALACLSEGKVMAAAAFGGVSAVFRVASNGTWDTTFSPAGGGFIQVDGLAATLVPQEDGRVLLGGAFTGGITRVTADGGLDIYQATALFSVTQKPVATQMTNTTFGQNSEYSVIYRTLIIEGSHLAGGTLAVSGDGVSVTHVLSNSANRIEVGLRVTADATPGLRDVILVNQEGGRTVLADALTITPSPRITAVSPSTCGQGAQSRQIDISGADFQDGARVYFEGVGGLSWPAPVFVSSQKLTVSLSIDEESQTGIAKVVVVNPDSGRVELTDGLTVPAGPKVTSISPNRLGAGAIDTSLVIIGTGFKPGATVTFTNPGVHVKSVSVDSATQLTVIADVDADAALGGGGFTVMNPDYGTDTVPTIGFTDGFLVGRGLETDGNAWASTANAMAVQTDGKILLGGKFNQYDGVTRKFITRLDPDGLLDTSFDAGNGITTTLVNAANAEVRALALQPDGKILVGGHFTSFNGVARNHIMRLNTDGSLDTTFNPGSGMAVTNIATTSWWVGVNAIKVLPDGRILAAGCFESFNGQPRSGIVRLNSDGSIDTGFATSAGATVFYMDFVKSMVVRPDGKILLGGMFSKYAGVTVSNMVLLNENGSYNSPFATVEGRVHRMDQQADGKILLAGYYSKVNGTNRGGIARVNADGSLDTTFVTGAGISVSGGEAEFVKVLPDGKILISGDFDFYNGTKRGDIARLNSDGTLDLSFVTWFTESFYSMSAVEEAHALPDGKLLIAGAFKQISTASQFDQFSYVWQPHVARLFADGSLDAPQPASAFGVNAGPVIASLDVTSLSRGTTGATLEVRGSGFVDGAVPAFSGTGVTIVSSTIHSPVRATLVVNVSNAATTGQLSLILTNPDGGRSSLTSALTITSNGSLSAAEAWRQQHFGTAENAGNAADLAKPDGDGVPNLMKYALGLTPGQNGAGSLPKARIATNSGSRYLSLSFTRDPSRNDVTIVVEVQSSIGGAWTEIARSVNGAPFTGIGGVTETDAAGGTKDVEIRDTQTVGSAARRFMRVRAER